MSSKILTKISSIIQAWIVFDTPIYKNVFTIPYTNVVLAHTRVSDLRLLIADVIYVTTFIVGNNIYVVSCKTLFIRL
jgi:hypothetical protein